MAAALQFEHGPGILAVLGRALSPARAALLALVGTLSIVPFAATAQVQGGLPLRPADLGRLLNAADPSFIGRVRSGEAFDEFTDESNHEARGETGQSQQPPRDHRWPIAALERDFSARANEDLRQFGYNVFQRRTRVRQQPTGALYDSYQLGVGDQIIVTLHGQEWRNIRSRIDRTGRIILPQMRPIVGAGRTLGQVRAEIRANVKRSMLGTEAFVSVGKVRTVDVTVIGEVNLPGLYHLPGLASVIDALIRARGPNKNGSLRRIRVNRGSGTQTIDLYDLFINGANRQDLTLREGDRIIVPTIGATVALAGLVKRPGIYELPAGPPPLIRNVVRYAGGPVRPRGNRYVRISMTEDGRETVREHRRLGSLRASDGDVVIVQPGANIQLGGVSLEGAVRVPGRRSLSAARSVRQLVRDIRTLGKDAYLPFAVVRRLDASTHSPLYLPVNLLHVLAKRADMPLQASDSVIVFHRHDIQFLRSADVQAALSRILPPSVMLAGSKTSGATSESAQSTQDGRETCEREAAQTDYISGPGQGFLPQLPGAETPAGAGAVVASSAEPVQGGVNATGKLGRVRKEDPGLVRQEANESLVQTEFSCAGLRALSSLVNLGNSGRFANARRALLTQTRAHIVNVVSCPAIYDRYPDLLPFVLDYVVAIDGEVLVPGVYPVASETSVTTITRIAGGLTREADPSKVEITRVKVSGAEGAAVYERSLHNISGGPEAPKRAIAKIGPGDSVRIDRVFTLREEGPVLLTGEFRRPGTYRIRRGEQLSQVVARAGGLTEQAYPFGAVFMRESVRRAQKAAFKRQAVQLEAKLAVQTGKAAGRAIIAGNSLIKRLLKAQPIGRVVIEADPTVLEVRPERDIAIEPGDHLIMPRRPTAVHVSGAVLNPGSLRFESWLTPKEYIGLAGGFDESADEDRVFVILPNGKAKPLQVSFWNYADVNIPPGSTIVVPRDPTPFELGIFLREATDIISKIALTAASLVAIAQ